MDYRSNTSGNFPLSNCAIISLAVALGLANGSPAVAADRSSSARAAFQRLYHCPSTGKPRGPCPGYEVDHREPICAGGADDLLNMQWLSIEAHKAKTREDVRRCAVLRKK